MDADESILRELMTAFTGPTADRGFFLSEEVIRLLEAACPPAPVSAPLRARCNRLADQAAQDEEFRAHEISRRRVPTLGAYLAYLRERAGISRTEASRRFRVEYQVLADLEQDRLSPVQLAETMSVRLLAGLFRRLHGSLDLSAELLVTTIQAPRLINAPVRDTLYRSGKSGSRTASEAASATARGEQLPQRENPAYEEEAQAVAALQEALRAAW